MVPRPCTDHGSDNYQSPVLPLKTTGAVKPTS